MTLELQRRLLAERVCGSVVLGMYQYLYLAQQKQEMFAP